jgi:hypothetical protein
MYGLFYSSYEPPRPCHTLCSPPVVVQYRAFLRLRCSTISALNYGPNCNHKHPYHTPPAVGSTQTDGSLQTDCNPKVGLRQSLPTPLL